MTNFKRSTKLYKLAMSYNDPRWVIVQTRGMFARLSVDPVDGLVAALNEEAILEGDDPEEKVRLCTRPFRTTAAFEYAVAECVAH